MIFKTQCIPTGVLERSPRRPRRREVRGGSSTHLMDWAGVFTQVGIGRSGRTPGSTQPSYVHRNPLPSSFFPSLFPIHRSPPSASSLFPVHRRLLPHSPQPFYSLFPLPSSPPSYPFTAATSLLFVNLNLE
ncbi:hypothetical protein BHM03_00036421 [Ensete ventricosum]|nr:hypothetical protein BHM03_00036421 [Ensete ventricosum]